MHLITSPSPFVQAFTEGHTGWLVLNRPERRNALNADMWAAIPPLMQALDAAPDVRVIVIRGEGPEAFAAGADISEFGAARNDAAAARAYEELNGRAFHAIRGAAKPVIAMVRGFCIGGGLAIALACDLRIAVPEARFFYPVMRLGFLPQPSDPPRLTALVGPARARMILMAGQRIGADEALAWGLIDRIAESGDLMDVARALASDALGAEPGHVAAIKAMT